MKRPRVSIAAACVVLGLLAFDMAWIRHVVGGDGSILGFGGRYYGILDLGILAMLNVMAIGFCRLSCLGWKSSFWAGFQVASVGAVVMTAWCYRMMHVGFESLFDNRFMMSHPPFKIYYYEIAFWMFILAAPMLLFSCLSGLAARLVAPKDTR